MNEVFAENTVSMSTPVLDPKFMVFPKVLEGVTESVITELRQRMAEYMAKEADKKKRQEEEKKFLWNQSHISELPEAAA